MKTRPLLTTPSALLLLSQLMACSAEPGDPADALDTGGPADSEGSEAPDDDAEETGDDGADDTNAGTTEHTLSVDGEERSYLLTVPAGTTGDEAVPLLLNLHALMGSAEGQLADSGFEAVADREGFLLVTPQAVEGVWTVTDFPVDRGADDFAFLHALVEQISQDYAVDVDRIYATGMSQGGFLAFDLVCGEALSLAAIASVSGVMTTGMAEACAPERPVPVMQVHGTADIQIDYETSQAAVAWWVAHNDASPEPEVTTMPDVSPDDGTTFERFVYAGGEAGVEVQHLRVNGGGHVWPGASGDSDVDLAEEIWSFVSRYDINGRIEE